MRTFDPNQNDYMETDDDFPCDLYQFIDYTDDPPLGLFPPEEERADNPFCETILRKIGNTWYSIRTECDGTESLTDKVKRLIFNDPLSRVTRRSGKVVLQG